MTQFKIYGASDDLVEIDGDIREELMFYAEDDTAYVACYDGTLLSVTFDLDGWHFRCISVGYAFDRVEPFVPGGDAYSDNVYFNDEQDTQIYKWFAISGHYEVAQ